MQACNEDQTPCQNFEDAVTLARTYKRMRLNYGVVLYCTRIAWCRSQNPPFEFVYVLYLTKNVILNEMKRPYQTSTVQ